MKKYISPVAAGGAPLNNERFINEIGAEFWTAIESILQGVSAPAATGNAGVIVSGCAVTGVGPYNCSAGVVYLAGQFMAFPGFAAQTLNQYILPATVVNIAKTFADGVSRNLIAQSDATFQAGVPGAGQYITLSLLGNLQTPGGVRLENLIYQGIFSDSGTGVSITGTATNTILTLPTTSNKIYRMKIDLFGQWTGGSTGGIGDMSDIQTIISVKNVAGILTIVNTTVIYSFRTDLTNSPTLTPTISGTNILINSTVTSGATYNVRAKAIVVQI